MSGYLGQAPGQGQIQYFTFTATAGQTTFTGIDDNKYVLNYDIGFCDVFLNGRRLTPNSDYTATNGSTVVLQSAASLNDVIFVASASTFSTANWVTNAVNYVYIATAGQTTFTGGDSNGNSLSYVNGTILVSVNGINLPQSDFTATNGSTVILNSGVNAGDIVQIFSLRTMAVSNFLPLTGGAISGSLTVGNSTVNTYITAGNIALNGSTLLIGNSTSNVVITGTTLTISNSTSNASFGTGPAAINAIATNTFTVGTSVYFKANGNVGVGTTSPAYKLDVKGPAYFHNDGSHTNVLCATDGASNHPVFQLNNVVGDWDIGLIGANQFSIRDRAAGFAQRVIVDSNGNVGIGAGSLYGQLHITATTNHGVRTLNLSPAGTGGGGGSCIIMGNSDSGGTSGPCVITAANRSLMFGLGNSFTSASGGSVTNYMSIDSNGYIRKPYHPSFGVDLVSAGAPSAGSVVTYNNTRSSDPSGGTTINLSNGRYTAPIDGRYYFSFVSFSEVSSSVPIEIYMRKNGSAVYRNYQSSSINGYEGLSTIAGVISLQQGDYVDIYVNQGSLHGNFNCVFSGFLIG